MTLPDKGSAQNHDEDYPFLDMSLVDGSEVSLYILPNYCYDIEINENESA